MKNTNTIPRRLTTKIGKAIRKELLGWGEFPEDLSGACAIASYIFWKFLREHGFRPDFVLGSYDAENNNGEDSDHCWIEWDGEIIDLTATQFDFCPAVHVTSVDDEDYVPEHRNQAAFKDIRSWTSDQRPMTRKKQIESVLRRLKTEYSDLVLSERKTPNTCPPAAAPYPSP